MFHNSSLTGKKSPATSEERREQIQSVGAQCLNELSPSVCVIPTHHPSIRLTQHICLERVSSTGQYAPGSPIKADEYEN